ncbi:hypothetical protein FN846DRAFT_991248 [Sphaerosporella brunnea]|uniref:Uncharacterized protein n=1 Tax=Sphaerosporella brunnea TaxID=1250544 RepID=A0A5J5F831_9PEZI|nr:hypothetical protein FN846DRAFT_991248 [Sphaerosporella brunnea]
MFCNVIASHSLSQHELSLTDQFEHQSAHSNKGTADSFVDAYSTPFPPAPSSFTYKPQSTMRDTVLIAIAWAVLLTIDYVGGIFINFFLPPGLYGYPSYPVFTAFIHLFLFGGPIQKILIPALAIYCIVHFGSSVTDGSPRKVGNWMLATLGSAIVFCLVVDYLRGRGLARIIWAWATTAWRPAIQFLPFTLLIYGFVALMERFRVKRLPALMATLALLFVLSLTVTRVGIPENVSATFLPTAITEKLEMITEWLTDTEIPSAAGGRVPGSRPVKAFGSPPLSTWRHFTSLPRQYLENTWLWWSYNIWLTLTTPPATKIDWLWLLFLVGRYLQLVYAYALLQHRQLPYRTECIISAVAFLLVDYSLYLHRPIRRLIQDPQLSLYWIFYLLVPSEPTVGWALEFLWNNVVGRILDLDGAEMTDDVITAAFSVASLFLATGNAAVLLLLPHSWVFMLFSDLVQRPVRTLLTVYLIQAWAGLVVMCGLYPSMVTLIVHKQWQHLGWRLWAFGRRDFGPWWWGIMVVLSHGAVAGWVLGGIIFWENGVNIGSVIWKLMMGFIRYQVYQ